MTYNNYFLNKTDKARVAGIFGAMAVSFLNLFYYIQVREIMKN